MLTSMPASFMTALEVRMRNMVVSTVVAVSLAVGGIFIAPQPARAQYQLPPEQIYASFSCTQWQQQVQWANEYRTAVCAAGALGVGFGILFGTDAALMCGAATASWEVARLMAYAAGC